ncbi:MAG: glycosyltransferase family 4 protein [Candidatus Sumerlaeaceae bacterium]
MSLGIAYLLLEWPRYSETFILNELLALAPHGQPIHIFCIQQSGETQVPQEFAAKTEFLSDASSNVTLSSNDVLCLLESNRGMLTAEVQRAYSRFEARVDIDDVDKRRQPLFALACALHLLSRCRELKITHVHCHYANLPVMVAEIAYKLGGAAFSFTGHAKDIFTMEPAQLGKKIAAAKFAVSCSEAGRATLVGAAAPEHADRIHRVYHGIWNRDWQVERQPPGDGFRILAVGRLTPKKGFYTLVQALSILRARGIEVTAEIIGEGRERDALLSLADRLRVTDCLQLPGKLSQQQIRERFKSVSVLVLPSIILESNNQDGLANALLEAMAAAVPVIASDIPALLEVVTNGETGLLFPSGNAEALADSLQELSRDQVRGERLGAAARARVAQFDCSMAAEQLMTLFRRYVTA